MSNKNIWYLPGPFHQYEEDVKALAKEHGLRIIDASATGSREDAADEVPDVTIKEVEPHPALVVGGNSLAELEDLIGKLRIESDTVRAVIDGLEAGEIEKPEAGELAIRLFHSLDDIRLQMVDLAGARDDLAAENETLRNELAELRASEGVEVKALKAQLDAAGVTYRANASKESLEKLVADLPKA
jgi:hypothetical protein